MGGKRPSRLIAKIKRVPPYKKTIKTVVIPMTAPSETMPDIQSWWIKWSA
ncbi:hypothetical protein WDC_1558 [Paucilactobacillus wasatchensis]|uniref:Uncharacterized protein n=1 Tax=Paucilactobacillus wasatchensis TaxID=1335616 RepID=A0A0D1A5A5_9LACO|nr:hypothetical protein WDC_1558 [Paucilactobacillus wasatchensis]